MPKKKTDTAIENATNSLKANKYLLGKYPEMKDKIEEENKRLLEVINGEA